MKIKLILLLLLFSGAVYSQNEISLKLPLVEKKLPFGLTKKEPENLPKVGIALSGGGARAISHVGVLRAIEESHIPIKYITGTSMGSIIGGLYCSGYSIDEIDSIVNSIGWDDFFSAKRTNRRELFVDQKITEDRAILAFRLDGLKPVIPTSINTGQEVSNFLTLVTLNAPIPAHNSFNNLLYEYRAVSTDLISGKAVILSTGSLASAMRASSSVTFLLPALEQDSLKLVDGGLVANIPVDITRQLGADIVIASDASSPLYKNEELNFPWVVADQLVSIPMQLLNNQQLEKADISIKPELGGLKNNDFDTLKNVINLGYDSAKEKIEILKNIFKESFDQSLPLPEINLSSISLSENPNKYEKELFEKTKDIKNLNTKDILYELYLIIDKYDLEDADILISSLDNKKIIKINYKEKPIVNEIELFGLTQISAERGLSAFKDILHTNFNSNKVLHSLISFLKVYKSEGYLLADIQSVNFDSTTGVLSIKMNEGLIDDIVVMGNSKTNPKIITREFNFDKGDFFNYNAIKNALVSLGSTNLFDKIELQIRDNNNRNDLYIIVSERPSAVLRFGLRIDNEYLTQMSFDIRDENLFGSATEFGVILSGGLKNRSYILEHKSNRIFNSYLTYKIRGFFQFDDVNVYRNDTDVPFNQFNRVKTGEYRQINYGGSFGIGAQTGKFGSLLFEGRYQNDQIKSKYDYPGPNYSVDISSIRISIVIDSQNEYPFPRSGFLINSYYETAQTAFGGDVGYTKLLFDYKNYLDLTPVHNFNFRFIVGFADETLPLSQNFSLGGQNSFFGLRNYEFRGRQIFSSSAEYRYKFPFKLLSDTYFKLRYDLGSIWAKREAIRFKDLRHGVGASIALDSPIGPMEFSVGRSFYFSDVFKKNTLVKGPIYFYFTAGYYF
ncbi:MAG: BamA/TamA family outer membrane protein [Melioribacteraceae bacterium]|nr:BamA/TamA family outer membrane protein [Melioribacteraceae bacterium]